MNRTLFAVGKRVVGTANRPVARRRLQRALPMVERPFALEVGGRRPRPGWFVTDVGATTRHFLDATAPWPIEDGALSYVFADNMIEHVDLEAARRFLREAHRCLQPGAVIRLVTPDIGRHVELYLTGAEAVHGFEAEHYRELGLAVEHPVDLVRIPIGAFGHHTGQVYDRSALAAELTHAGFHDPTPCDVGASTHAQLRGLERRTDGGRWQLILEATR